MLRAIYLSALLMALTVATPAYDPPSQNVANAIRAYTQPDILRLWVGVDGNCDVDGAEVDGEIEAEMIRSRIERTDSTAGGWLALYADCGRATSTLPYVYTVSAELTVYVEAPSGKPFRGSVMSAAMVGSFGTTHSPEDIHDAIVAAAEHALTDFIYAHSME